MFLGIDLGTSSIKAVLADQTGTLMDHESAEYPVCYPHEGWSEESHQDWLEGLYTVLAGLGSRHDLSRVEGISFCGQMHRLVVLDKADRVIRPSSARVTGGAAKSPVWLLILSDVLGLELCTINTHDGGALGAVLLAMTGFGRLSDAAEAAQAVIRDADRSLPDPEHHYLYADNLGNSSNYTAGIQSSLARSHLTEVEHPSDGLIENQ